VVLFLKVAKPVITAQARYLVSDDLIEFLGEGDGQKWTLADFRQAVAELVLLQSAAGQADSPDLAAAAWRVALRSKIDEVVWWGGSQILQRDIPASLKGDLATALKAAPAKGKTRDTLQKCLKKAG
jgi:hypothetical protein